MSDIFDNPIFDPDWVLDDADTIPDNNPESTIGEHWDEPQEEE